MCAGVVITRDTVNGLTDKIICPKLLLNCHKCRSFLHPAHHDILPRDGGLSIRASFVASSVNFLSLVSTRLASHSAVAPSNPSRMSFMFAFIAAAEIIVETKVL